MRFYRLFFVMLLISCSSGNEDTLNYGMTKVKADLQLSKSASLSYSTEKACPETALQSDENIGITRKDKRYQIELKKKPSLKRLVIYHKAPPKTEMSWKWKSPNSFAVYGRFELSTNPSCFFLNDGEGLGTEEVGSLELYFDGRHRIQNILAFSTREEKMANCNYAENLRKVEEAYRESREDFLDEKKFKILIKALLAVLPAGGCKRSFDTSPVPMYLLCGHLKAANCSESDVFSWFSYVRTQKDRFTLADRFLKSSYFQKSLRGKLFEEFSSGK